MSRFSAFVGGSEWLNDTMRLNRAFWMGNDNISAKFTSASGRTVAPSQYGAFMKVLDSIWEISAKTRSSLANDPQVKEIC